MQLSLSARMKRNRIRSLQRRKKMRGAKVQVEDRMQSTPLHTAFVGAPNTDIIRMLANTSNRSQCERLAGANSTRCDYQVGLCGCIGISAYGRIFQ